MTFKQQLKAAYSEAAYQDKLDTFIAAVKENMLTSAAGGHTGVTYMESDILCRVKDFEAWLKKESLTFYWLHGWFSERELFIEFGI